MRWRPSWTRPARPPACAAGRVTGEGGYPQHAVRGGDGDEYQPAAFSEHEPADDVTRAPDHESAQRGVRRARGQVGQVEGQIVVREIVPCEQSKGGAGQRRQHERRPEPGAGARRAPRYGRHWPVRCGVRSVHLCNGGEIGDNTRRSRRGGDP